MWRGKEGNFVRSPSLNRPSEKSSMTVKALKWLEALAGDRSRGILIRFLFGFQDSPEGINSRPGICTFLSERISGLRIIKMCLNKTLSRVRVSKYLLGTFAIHDTLENENAFSHITLI
jgi:hypothetical protein